MAASEGAALVVEPARVAPRGAPARVRPEIHEIRARTVLNRVRPPMPFRWSANPYRGCQHACAYCYARPSHQYWGFGAGTDFEREIIVKTNAKELLLEAFDRPSWKGEAITFSGN